MISFSFPPTIWGHIHCKNLTPMLAHLETADSFLRDSVIGFGAAEKFPIFASENTKKGSLFLFFWMVSEGYF